MKKILSLFVVLIMVAALFSACDSEGVELNLYFKDAYENKLTAEKRAVEADEDASEQELAKLAVNELIRGPESEECKPVISKEAKLISLAVNGKVATVNFSGHYTKKKGVDELILRFAVVNTLCDIEGIDGVVIQVEGKNLVSEATGKELGVLRKDNIALATEDKLPVTLYFPDKKGEFLVGEVRQIDTQNALSIEKIIVDELIKGPGSKELSASVSKETKLISIETKDKVCYVNFSAEFINRTKSGSAATTLTLYSVVNSLCSLKNVESVQILINGEAGIEFGNFVLDIPYEANYDLVK